jgi:superfamily II DNA helicase RecQ
VVTRKTKGEKPRRGAAVSSGAQPNAALLDKLKSWRFVEAQSQSVPAFVIFHDSTLAGIAAANPKTLADLAEISGIGAKKLERYGEAILALLHG